MIRNPVRVNELGRLRVKFLDAAFSPIQATGVTVDLFAPGSNPDTDTPTVSGLTPNYIGDGVFELNIVPTGPGGQWVDRWSGNILGVTTTTTQRFEVITGGFIASYPISGLGENTLVQVTITPQVKSVTAKSLASDYVFSFATKLSPFYSSAKKVKLDAGGLLGALPDNIIDIAILEASIEADILNFRKTIGNEELFVHARRQYVTCMAAMMLAQNVLASGGVLKSKMLADFKVEYDVNILGDLLNRLKDCIAKWEGQVITGGASRSVRGPRMVIKGETDPDRVSAGRLWNNVAPGENPIGNARYRSPGFRRWKTGWTDRNRGGHEW
jgi:hypothetical protein